MPWWFRTIFWALLLCFLAGLLLGLLIWWWRQRHERESYERLRLEREAESDRLRLRISSLQEQGGRRPSSNRRWPSSGVGPSGRRPSNVS